MKVCCITGMHRSGTSLLMRVTHLLGVDLGDERELLPAAEDNPHGFFEHGLVKRVNDRVLSALGGSWHEPPPLPPGWESGAVLDPARKAAAEVVAQHFRGRGLVGWKDPRTSLLLPFWRTVVPIERTILSVRAPDEVAHSLGARNGFSSEKAARLWLRYTVRAWLDDPDRLVVLHHDLFERLEETVDGIRDHLSLAEPSDEQMERIRAAVEPGLRHHEQVPAPAGEAMRLARATYRALLGAEPDDLRALLEAVAASWDAEGRALAAESSREEVEEAFARLEAELEEAGRQAEELADQVRGEAGRAEYAEARLARLADERDEARGAARKAERQAARDRADRERQRRRAEQQEQRASARAAQLTKATERARAAERALERADRERRQLQRAHDRLRRRRAVRLALALAGLLRPLFRAVRGLRKRLRRGGGASPTTGTGSAGATGTGGTTQTAGTTRTAGAVTPAGGPTTAGGATTAGETKAGDASWAPESGWEGERAGMLTPLRLDHDRASRDLAAADALAQAGPVTVIVPVFNAPGALRRCLDALVRNTTWPARVLLIDDASTDPAIAGLLAEAAALEGVTVLRNERNLGFVRTVNRGFEASDTDVVVLNSDTEVTPRWLENMVLAAYRAGDIGTVTAVSNNAGAFSVPMIGVGNAYPDHLSLDDVGRLVTQTSERRYVEAPTGNGFCLYVKRPLLEAVGGFDAERFPRGYGEENDLCMRATEAGWRHVVDDATLVFHARGASFGEEREALMKAGRAQVDARHPTYTQRVRAFVRSPELAAVQERVRAAYEHAASEPVRPRVLFVVHEGGGGTPQTNLDLMRALEPRYDCFLLTSDTRTLRLRRLVDSELEPVTGVRLAEALAFGETTRRDYRQVVATIMTRLGVELVHVRHLFKHTLDVPGIAAALRVPVVVSLHDFYLSCPTVHLLDDHDRFCGGVCTPGHGSCRVPSGWVRESVPPLKHEWVHEWRRRVGAALEHCDALVTTSPTAREVYRRSYPRMHGKDFEVIEHGRDLAQSSSLASPPRPGGTIKILLPGNLDVHKGTRFLAELHELDTRDQDRLELHFLGEVPAGYERLGTVHGPYEREEFSERVKEIGPAFIGLFSVWPETYSHTLSEAWASGVPVLTSRLGALGERVSAHGGGWTVDVTDTEAAYAEILAVADDEETYQRGLARATIEGVRTVAEMAADYDRLYKRVRLERRAVVSASRASKHGRRVPRVGLLVVGDGRAHPGSVHVRTLRRFSHPHIAARVDATVLDAAAVARGEAPVDLLYVQRTAVPPALAEPLVERCRNDRVPLVFDLDDNLVDEQCLPAGEEWAAHLVSLRRLASAAALVTVSTPALAEALAPYAARVAVVPNQLDERLWYAPEEVGGEPADPVGPALRLVYIGTTTHADDLALLRPVLPALRRRLGRHVVLDVVGGEPRGPGQDWYERVRVPGGFSAYPNFVPWLRSIRGRWDIAVSPLAETPFNRYKSDLKFLEYSALGLPGVYSLYGPYEASVEAGVTGELAGAGTDAWVEALARLADADRRETMAREARGMVLRERTIRVHAEEHLDVLFSALGAEQ